MTHVCHIYKKITRIPIFIIDKPFIHYKKVFIFKQWCVQNLFVIIANLQHPIHVLELQRKMWYNHYRTLHIYKTRNKLIITLEKRENTGFPDLLLFYKLNSFRPGGLNVRK